MARAGFESVESCIRPIQDQGSALSREANQITDSPAGKNLTGAKDSSKLEKNGVLPVVELTYDSDSPNTNPPCDAPCAEGQNNDFWAGVGRVAGEVWDGAVDEVTHHPDRILGDVAIGAGIAIGATLLAPELALAAGVAAVGVGAAALIEHAPGWIDAALTVADPTGHSAAELTAAENELHGVGAGAAHLTAGAVGGVGATMARGAITSGVQSLMSGSRGAIIDAEYTLVDDAVIGTSRAHGAIAGPAERLALAGPEERLALPAPEQRLSLPAPEEPIFAPRADQVATAAGGAESGVLSTAQTASLFDRLATEGGGVLSFVKKPYTVEIRPGVAGETVVDMAGNTQTVAQNSHVVRRLYADGRIDTYPINEQNFQTRWQPTGNAGEYSPLPVPTTMVRLTNPVAIEAHAGTQTAVASDMLVTDGQSFWTLQQKAFLDTYVGANPRSQAVLEEVARLNAAQ